MKNWNEAELAAYRKEELKRRKRVNQRKHKYGISEEETYLMLEDQRWSCAICYDDISERFVIDHNHWNRKVRGLLCYRCNLLLGFARESPEILRTAAIYIEERSHLKRV